MISLEGIVVRGRGASKELGYPTANIRYLKPEAGLLSGVWTAYVWVQSVRYEAVAIVGVWKQPDGSPSVEAHLFDFAGDLYDRSLRIELIEHLKPLTVCPNFEALKQQVAADATQARERLKTYPSF